jgi:hypothetical protein
LPIGPQSVQAPRRPGAARGGIRLDRGFGDLKSSTKLGRRESGPERLEGGPYGLEVACCLLTGQADPVIVQRRRETVERTVVGRGGGERAAELTQFQREQARPGLKDSRPVGVADLAQQRGTSGPTRSGGRSN